MSFFDNILLMIRRAVWKLRRILIIILILLLVSSIIYVIVIFRERAKNAAFSAIIDADTGNGIAGLLAISRALADPGFEVIGLTSVQWNQLPEANVNTVDISQNLNDTLLKLFKKESVPHPRGGGKMIAYEDGHKITPSEASEFIIKKAGEYSIDKKLNIITLGSMTNLAAAILSDSLIVPKLRIYSLVMHFDPATNVWNKNELNARNDLDALDLVLNTKGLEIHIMPVSSSREFVFEEDEIVDHMIDKGEPWNFIALRLLEKSSEKKEINFSDVALLEGILNPDYVKELQVNTPPENYKRQVFVYSSINKDFMKIDYWRAIKKQQTNNK